MMKMYAAVVFAVLCGTASLVLDTAADRMQDNDMNSAMITANNAAFRDGLYLGKLNAQRGREFHLVAARWSRDPDRRDFVAGYMRGYLQVRSADQQRGAMSRIADNPAFRDGMEDGARDRDNGQPRRTFTAASGQPSAAYGTGYQLAYYGPEDDVEALVFRLGQTQTE